LRPRERLELCGAAQVLGSQALLLPELRHIVHLPDDVGRAVEQRHAVIERVTGGAFELGRIAESLARRIDHCVVD
jgi:hypothetical protein